MSGAQLPAFFGASSVDDSKYESLLEDLRAHDLLGPDITSTAGVGGSAPPPGFTPDAKGIAPTQAGNKLFLHSFLNTMYRYRMGTRST